ncbi:uncharacterized protein PG986_006346 [Apiospora aurea]|uniref:Uncharacterized protein n=1 Tax=Apiospora aurea TaxID=335848 RepID=A0ABR1QK62_9PEZI
MARAASSQAWYLMPPPTQGVVKDSIYPWNCSGRSSHHHPSKLQLDDAEIPEPLEFASSCSFQLLSPESPVVVRTHTPLDPLQHVPQLAPVLLDGPVPAAVLVDEAVDAPLVVDFLPLVLRIAPAPPRLELDGQHEPEREVVPLGDHGRVMVVVVLARHPVPQVRDGDELADDALGHGHDAELGVGVPGEDDAQLPEPRQELRQRGDDEARVGRGGGDVVGADEDLDGRGGAVGAPAGAPDGDAAGLEVDVGDVLEGPAGQGAREEAVQDGRLVELEVLVLVDERVAAQVVVDALAGPQQAGEGAGAGGVRDGEGAFPVPRGVAVDGDVGALEAGFFVDFVP